MAIAEPVAILTPVVTRTTGATDPALWDWGREERITLSVNATAVSGAGATLSVILEGSNDNGATFFTVATVPNITTVSVTDFTVQGQFPNVMRARCVITGTTPSFTYSVVAGRK